MAQIVQSWEELGARVAGARRMRGLTQSELAELIGVDRTALTKIESGKREVDSFELALLARALDQSVESFVVDAPPSIVSRRDERVEADATDVDALLEELARNVELLLDLGTLKPNDTLQIEFADADFAAAELAATATREALRQSEGPLLDLPDHCVRLGLLPFSFSLGQSNLDGAYIALGQGGVAIVNGDMDPGRRRFDLAHELGHHIAADPYATDSLVMTNAAGRERVINAFAIYLLMPRKSVCSRWLELSETNDARYSTFSISVEYRVSWSAACLQLRNLELLTAEQHEILRLKPPTKADFLESGFYYGIELEPPYLPQSYARAVLQAFRSHKVTAERTLDLLWNTISQDDLPERGEIPLESLVPELDPFE